MQPTARLCCLILLLLVIVAGPKIVRADESSAEKKIRVVTVGITEYQPLSDTYEKYERLFQELSDADPHEHISFSFAVGTYGEVKDWYDKKLIDVAILSAMPVAELLNSASESELDWIKKSYVGDLADVPKPGKFSIMELYQGSPYEAIRQKPENLKYLYRTACIVRKDSKLQSLSQLKRMMDDKEEQQKIKFLFVRPVSVSGFILPLYFLKERGINPLQPQTALDFTYQHKESLRRLLSPAAEDEKYKDYTVGFVNDTLSYDPQTIDSRLASEQQFRLLKDDLPAVTDNLKLETTLIPHEAVLINHHLIEDGDIKQFNYYVTLMRHLFLERDNKLSDKTQQGAVSPDKNGGVNKLDASNFQKLKIQGVDDWMAQYTGVTKWLQEAHLPREVFYRSTFDDLLRDLSAYKESPINAKNPLRLAMVLSGGGAKCAYQAGAIEAIENRLRELHQQNKYNDIDIDLVVGTSGGAINALVTALGVTQDVDGQGRLGNTWKSFHQRDFFQPSLPFNIIFGIFFFGFLQMLIVVTSVLLFGREHVRWKALFMALGALVMVELLVVLYFQYPKVSLRTVGVLIAAQILVTLLAIGLIRLLRRVIRQWWQLAGWIMVFFSTIEIILYYWPGPQQWPWGLDENHWFLHFWMLVTLYSIWSFPWPLLIGSVMVISSYMITAEDDLTRNGIRLITGTSIVLIVISFVLAIYVLRASAPSTEKGIDKAFADGLPGLLALRPVGGNDAKARLKELSQQIVSGPNSFKRDLVITNSRLPMDEQTEREQSSNEKIAPSKLIEANQLPQDLYFYFKRDSAKSRPSDARFISLKKNPDKLLDIVIGSSTIYPLFPSRELTKLNVGNEDKPDDQLKIAPAVQIIDGGFIHNSPIEAAQRWGATHIIQIDASPEWEPSAPSNFVQNIMLAFNYLFAQAQRTDQLAKGGVEIFKLRPTSECEKLNLKPICTDYPQPDMDTFDFDPKLIQGAYDVGRSDVKSPRPLFQRVPGEPVFRNVKAP